MKKDRKHLLEILRRASIRYTRRSRFKSNSSKLRSKRGWKSRLLSDYKEKTVIVQDRGNKSQIKLSNIKDQVQFK